MKLSFRRNKKGMSVVISSVIIVAVSITMAIAVAFWAMGIGDSFLKFEKVEFVSIYADTPKNQYFAEGTAASARVLSLTGDAVANPIQIDYPGSEYNTSTPPSVVFEGGGGSGVAARATVENGRIVSIFVENGGSNYTSLPTITIQPPSVTGVSCFPIYIQLRNTGSSPVTINNVFLNGRPYVAYQYISQDGGQNLVDTVINVGARNNNLWIFLPEANQSGLTGWSSGDYVEVEVQTTSGHLYSSTVLLP